MGIVATKLGLFGVVQMALSLCLLLPDHVCMGRGQGKHCPPSSCGNISIRYPFRLSSDPSGCGDKRMELACESNNRTTLAMKYGKFYVKEPISYENSKIRLVDACLHGDDQCSIPCSSYIRRSSSCGSVDPEPFESCNNRSGLIRYQHCFGIRLMYFLKCEAPIDSEFYVDASPPCTTNNRSSSASYSSSPPAAHFYFLDEETSVSNFSKLCRVEAQVPFMLPVGKHLIRGARSTYIYKQLSLGFELYWDSYNETCWHGNISPGVILRAVKYALESYVDSFLFYLLGGPHITYNHLYPLDSTYFKCLIATGAIISARLFLGVSILLFVVIYKFRRRHLSDDDAIEDFLQNHNDMMPIRYSYSQIKAMTGGFKDKLGQGGFGSVFKGKLCSGRFVAIKLLGKPKAGGQDFINEIATIGRIHHVNVMGLVGYCLEGSKQALIYDFMPNGSLDKFIFSRENSLPLSWEKLYEIALGIARGIEYLHRGCEMQILHFDIKPHNILLDDNFNPKVSDFGLAKLYPVEDSIVSLTAARGTMGYIAPELFYNNLGGVSYKADVYSFGMLLMEMVGRRKNLNESVQQSSQIYFPTWVYNRFDRGDDMELLGEDASEAEKDIVRKIVIVALWCIQMRPANRPSMSRVLEMFESPVELLETPPKPFLVSLDIAREDLASTAQEESATALDDDSSTDDDTSLM